MGKSRQKTAFEARARQRGCCGPQRPSPLSVALHAALFLLFPHATAHAGPTPAESAPRRRSLKRGHAPLRLLVVSGVLCTTALFLTGVIWRTARRPPSPPNGAATQSGGSPAPYDPSRTQKTLEFLAAKARDDPESAMTFAMLAQSYLARCRETGDLADAARAEQAARRSLQIRTAHNLDAFSVLGQCLLTQHRFSEALQIAQAVLARRPDERQALYTAAEALMETGEYTAAKRTLEQDPRVYSDPFGRALRARLVEISGRPAQALRELEQAARQAETAISMPPTTAAWFFVRLGTLHASLGHAELARSSFGRALELFPQDYRAMAGIARLEACRQRWHEAIDWATRAAARVPAPDTLAILGDAFAGAGRAAEAEKQYALIDSMARLAKAQGAVYDRTRALFLADHRRRLDEAEVLARRELLHRHDIYTYDALAWVCFQRGRLLEADRAIRRAMASGTKDAVLYYHAGRIAAARGDRSRAQEMLARSLALNPEFHPSAPEIARRLLANMGAGPVRARVSDL